MAISSYGMTDISHAETIISSVARNAVVYDKIFEVDDVDFRVEAGGNVVVIEAGSHTASIRRANESACTEKENLIVVPREVAFERIADATQEKVDQLRKIYEKMCTRDKRWFYISGVAVVLACLSIALTGMAAASIALSSTLYVPVLLSLIIVSFVSIGIVGYTCRWAQIVSGQAKEYLDHFLQVEKFNETVKIVAELAVDETVRGALQEIIIAKSLGLRNGSSENGGARQNGAVQPGK